MADPFADLIPAAASTPQSDPFADLVPKQPQSNTSPFADLVPASSSPSARPSLPPIDLSSFLRSANPNALSPSVVSQENTGTPEGAISTFPAGEFSDLVPRPQGDSVPAGITRGVENTVLSQATLPNAAIIGAMGAAPAAISKAAALYFGFVHGWFWRFANGRKIRAKVPRHVGAFIYHQFAANKILRRRIINAVCTG